MKTFQDGDPLFGAMMHAIANLWPNGTAVLSGCAPTGSSTTRQVTVAGGTVVINGTVVSVSQQIKTLDAATFDRYDLISINTSGAVVATKGTEERRVPAIPANTVPIAICLVETGQTALPTDRIYDTRMDALRLSALNVDADKNWNGKSITNTHSIATSYLSVDKITFTRKMSVADINGTIFYKNSNTYTVSTGQPVFTNIPTITVPPGLVDGSTITIAADIFSPSYRTTTLTCIINGVSTASLSYTPEVDSWGSSSNTVTIKSGDVISFALSPPGYLGGGATTGSVKNIRLRGNIVDMPMVSIANDPVWPPSI
jgi:hypothetical protein